MDVQGFPMLHSVGSSLLPCPLMLIPDSRILLSMCQLINESTHWNSTLLPVGFPEPGSVDFKEQ